MPAILRQRNYALLWFAGLISGIGDWALYIALPIYIYQVTHSPLATSGMFLAEIVPALLLGSVAGVFVDRLDRKLTMVVTNLLLTLGVLPLLAVHSSGTIWLVYVVALIQSSVSQFFAPAQGALIPRIVHVDDLAQANSLFSVSSNLTRLSGPSIGGAVAALTGLRGVTALDSVSFLGAALLIALIVVPDLPVERGGNAVNAASRAWRRLWEEWIAGLRVVRGDQRLMVIFGAFALSALGEGVMGVMFVVWVSKVIGGGAQQLGWFMSAQGVGGVVGGLVVGRISARLSPALLAGAGGIAFGLLDMALFVYPLFLAGLAPGLALIALVGIPAIAVGAGLTTLLQSLVDDAYRGRVFGMLGTTSSLLGLAGTLLAGALGGFLGPILLLAVVQGGCYVLLGLSILVLLVRPRRGAALDAV